MKKRISLVVSACLVVTLVVLALVSACTKPQPTPTPSPTSAATPAPAPKLSLAPVKLRLSSNYPTTDATGVRTVWFMNEVTKRTNGLVTFEPYWASALAGTAEHLDLIQRGGADIIDSSVLALRLFDRIQPTFAVRHCSLT